MTWVHVEGDLFARDFGEVRAYQLRMTINGREYVDLLGMLPLDQARLAGQMLRRNRETGRGPQSWTVMQAESLLRAEKETGRTLGSYWQERFWPHRLAQPGKSAENAHIAGRWANHLREFFAAMPLAALAAEDLEAFASAARAKGASEATILRCLQDLRRMWNLALRDGEASRVFPGRELILASGKRPAQEGLLTPAEALHLLNTAYARRLNSRMDHDIWGYIALALGRGLKAAEIHRLTLAEVTELMRKDREDSFVARFFGERLALYPPAGRDEPIFRPFSGKKDAAPIRQSVPRGVADLLAELKFNQTPERSQNPLAKIDFNALARTGQREETRAAIARAFR